MQSGLLGPGVLSCRSCLVYCASNFQRHLSLLMKLLVSLAIFVCPQPVWALPELHRIDAEQRLHREFERFDVICDVMDSRIHHCMIDDNIISSCKLS
jgi:hypothetical protein